MHHFDTFDYAVPSSTSPYAHIADGLSLEERLLLEAAVRAANQVHEERAAAAAVHEEERAAAAAPTICDLALHDCMLVRPAGCANDHAERGVWHEHGVVHDESDNEETDAERPALTGEQVAAALHQIGGEAGAAALGRAFSRPAFWFVVAAFGAVAGVALLATRR